LVTEEAQQQILKVNGCAFAEMRSHIDQAKAGLIERSEHEWTQDLSWLDRAG